MQLTEIFSNPTRMRITRYMSIHEEATTKEIASYLSDVPRRTLYRHINFLVDAGVLKVKEERRVRGGLERVLIDNTNTYLSDKKLSDSSYQFLMDIYNKFCLYEKKHGSDLNRLFDKDLLCMGTSTFYLDDTEMQAMLDEIRETTLKFEREHNAKYGDKTSGKLRSITLISAPADQE